MRPGGGQVISVTIDLYGQQLVLLNGGPQFHFSMGMSLFVNCDTQDEVDELWNKLTEEGKEQPCGWLTDKFGVSWQIIPSALGRLLGNPDPQKSQRVLQAMMKMKKIDIAVLQAAAE